MFQCKNEFKIDKLQPTFSNVNLLMLFEMILSGKFIWLKDSDLDKETANNSREIETANLNSTVLRLNQEKFRKITSAEKVSGFDFRPMRNHSTLLHCQDP